MELTEVAGRVVGEVAVELGAVGFLESGTQTEVRQLDVALGRWEGTGRASARGRLNLHLHPVTCECVC